KPRLTQRPGPSYGLMASTWRLSHFTSRRALTRSPPPEVSGGSGQAEPVRLHLVQERLPLRRPEGKLRPFGVRRVPHRDNLVRLRSHLHACSAVAAAMRGLLPSGRDLDAVAARAAAVGRLPPHGRYLDTCSAVAAAVAALAPYGTGQVHLSSAILAMRS